MDFLDIENKEDSVAKTASVAGLPTKNYLFALEVNKIRDAINALRSLVVLTSETITHIFSQVTPINLGVITEPFLKILNTNESIIMESGQFVTYTSMSDIQYVYLFLGIPGEYGTINSIYMADADFVLMYQSDTAPSAVSKKFRAIIIDGQVIIITDEVGYVDKTLSAGSCVLNFSTSLPREKTFFKNPVVDYAQSTNNVRGCKIANNNETGIALLAIDNTGDYVPFFTGYIYVEFDVFN